MVPACRSDEQLRGRVEDLPRGHVEFFQYDKNAAIEIAALLDVSEKTVQRHWNFAKVWLYQEIERSS